MQKCNACDWFRAKPLFTSGQMEPCWVNLRTDVGWTTYFKVRDVRKLCSDAASKLGSSFACNVEFLVRMFRFRFNPLLGKHCTFISFTASVLERNCAMVGMCSLRTFSNVLVISSVLCLCTRADDACDAPGASRSQALLQTQSAREQAAGALFNTNESIPTAGATAATANQSNGSAIIAMVDACLQSHLTGDKQEQALWHLVRTAEILSKLMAANISVKALGSDWPDDAGVIEAAMVAGRDAAEALVRRQFEAEAERLLGAANLTQEAIGHFTEKIAKMAEMCGDPSEAHTLAEDEASIMSGNMTMEEARVAKDLADYVEGLCQSDVLDLDFFVGQLADESPECNSLVADSQLLQMKKHLSVLDFYAKSALVLHDEQNKLGHHFAQRLHRHQREETLEVEPLLLQATLKHGSSKPRMTRLFYLDRLYYDKVHGFTKDQYCDSNFLLRKERPGHWISRSQEIQAYVNCLCVDKLPSLWCDAHHSEPLALLQPKLVQELQEENRKLSSLLQSGSPVGLGPCQDADGKPAPFDCSFCVNGNNCISTSGSYSLDVFGSIKELMGTSASCVKGYCTPCQGVKPGDPFQFKLDIGVEVSSCGSTADFLATYHYFAELKLCIGGILGEAADKIGWSLCQSIGRISYHPFISKFHFSMSLPIPLPAPLGVRASLAVNLNLGDISRACDNHCATFGPSEHFRCLQEFYAARGVTGVDFKVEVLLGVSIPFVGTVGKWFKVHSSGCSVRLLKAEVHEYICIYIYVYAVVRCLASTSQKTTTAARLPKTRLESPLSTSVRRPGNPSVAVPIRV